MGQRPCRVLEKIPSCNDDLVEQWTQNFADMKYVCDKPWATSIREVKKLYNQYKKNAEALKPSAEALLRCAENSTSALEQLVKKRNQNQFDRLEGTLKQGVASVSDELKRLNYSTVTIGLATSAAALVGVISDIGIAIDITSSKSPVRGYVTLGYSVGPALGAEGSVQVGFSTAKNNKLEGDGQGIVAGAGAEVSKSLGMEFSYKGKLMRVVFGAGAGPGLKAGASYGRTYTAQF